MCQEPNQNDPPRSNLSFPPQSLLTAHPGMLSLTQPKLQSPHWQALCDVRPGTWQAPTPVIALLLWLVQAVQTEDPLNCPQANASRCTRVGQQPFELNGGHCQYMPQLLGSLNRRRVPCCLLPGGLPPINLEAENFEILPEHVAIFISHHELFQIR
jgi:hypothetical protein